MKIRFKLTGLLVLLFYFFPVLRIGGKHSHAFSKCHHGTRWCQGGTAAVTPNQAHEHQPIFLI